MNHARRRVIHVGEALVWGGAFVLATLFAACGRDTTRSTDVPAGGASSAGVLAVANLAPTANNQARGTVRFVAEEGGLRVVAEVEGLTPGEHGFHVHEKGDCSAPDANSAGAHFNPTNQPHAGREAEARHVGDLGNITADANGKARVEFVDAHLALSGPNSIVGRSVIVHAGRDDARSQPSGESGARVACGVIELQ